MNNNTLHILTALVLIPLSALYAVEAPISAKPNVLIIYVDDMGWAQPGCYGGKMAATPNIDALAAGGVRFTQFYCAASICSPSPSSVHNAFSLRPTLWAITWLAASRMLAVER